MTVRREGLRWMWSGGKCWTRAEVEHRERVAQLDRLVMTIVSAARQARSSGQGLRPEGDTP